MSEVNQTPDAASDAAGQAPQLPARPWVAPQIETHQAKELTKSGGILTTDGGGQPSDCS
jgi:hypothetical protein